MQSTDIAILQGLRRDEAAKLIGCSTETLDRLHRSGRGPKRVKFGRICTYPVKDLIQWRDAQQGS